MKKLSETTQYTLFIVFTILFMILVAFGAAWLPIKAQAMSSSQSHAVVEFQVSEPQMKLKGSLPAEINPFNRRLDQSIGVFEDSKEHVVCYWITYKESIGLSCVGK